MVNIVVRSEKCLPLTQAMYGWSSYGGSNQGLVDEDLGELWSCQACGRQSGADDIPFYFEFSPREYIKICELCNTQQVNNAVLTLMDLIGLVRPNHESF